MSRAPVLPSIRSRLLLSILSIQVVGAVLATWLVVSHERRQAYVAFDASLGEQAAALRALVEAPEEPDGIATFHREFLNLPQGDRFVLADAKGRKIDGSSGWELPQPLPHAPRTLLDLTSGGTLYRVLLSERVPLADAEAGGDADANLLTSMYAAPSAPVEAYIDHVEMKAIAACLVLLALSNLMSSWALTHGLRPLRALAADAETIDIGHWSLPHLDESRRYRELKPLADALAALIERLQRAFERERQFFGDAAHEMKSAVAIVRSTLQLTLQTDRSAEDYRGGLKDALADTGRLQMLVSGMLELARVECGAVPGPAGDLCLAEVHAGVLRALERFQSLSIERQVALKLRSNEREIWVGMPENDLLTVLSNLVENAILYSDSGTEVIVATHIEAALCRIEVRDQGCGVAASVVPHLFERFYRSDASRARSSGGVGLGLAIAKALVERAGGKITVQSEEGSGSVFLLSLPRLLARYLPTLDR